MAEALGMRLEAIRTVLKNEVNEITVCVDKKRPNGVFYTMISITSAEVRRQIAQRMVTTGLFTTNSDYVGSFTREDSFNLVFLYHPENCLNRRELVLATDFVKRKQITEHFLIAYAEIQVTGSVGVLLLEERNINIGSDLGVYFNYFLDFADWNPALEDDDFYRRAAQYAFAFLSREYAEKFGGSVDRYPNELQVFYKKAQNKSFLSFSSILVFLRMIPDAPVEPRVGIAAALNRVKTALAWVGAHSTGLFLAGVVLVTVVYTGYQITSRMRFRAAAQENTTYVGLSRIGDVYLGDENI